MVGNWLNSVFGGGETSPAPDFKFNKKDYDSRTQGMTDTGFNRAENQYDQSQRFASQGDYDRQAALASAGKLGGVGQDYADYLSGKSGPSRAQMMAGQMAAQTQRDAYAMAQGQRGGPTAAGNRAAILAGANAGAAGNSQVSQLRAQEQEAARQGMLGAYGAQAQAYGGLRGQDLGGMNAAGNQAQGWAQRGLEAEQQRLGGVEARDKTDLGGYQAWLNNDTARQQGNQQSNKLLGFI